MDTDLELFRQQLDAVENALLMDPSNAELLKLKEDLNKLIEVSSVFNTPDGNQSSSSETHQWNVGDVCEAMWLDDGNYYRAIIDSIAVDRRTVTVTFTAYGETQECNVSRLKVAKETTTASTAAKGEANEAVDNKNKDEKEKLKAKKEKRRNRLAELEKEKEGEKKKWQSFNKGIIKKSKGKVKPSIFATTEEGKVGVIGSGHGMTEFDRLKKWAPSTKLNTISAPPSGF